jgi:trypsin
MRYPIFALSSSVVFFIIGCGSGSSSKTLNSVLVSDAYIVNAKVLSGNVSAYEDTAKGVGWYQFEAPISENIVVTGGVNDINPTNGIADNAEPYAPKLQAPSHYRNITPLTTMMLIDKQFAKVKYPNAYTYNPSFDFDVVKISKQNLSIAKENTKAAFELSAMDGAKRVTNLRIINGEKVQDSDDTWRFIVSLQNKFGHSCGGSLISSEWILTAGHCIGFTDIALANTYSLTIGGEKYTTDRAISHPLYNEDTVDNDIGLLHLKTPVTSVTPIALNHSLPIDDSMIQVAGWGNTLTEGSYYPDDLMQVSMPVINFDTCNNSYLELTDNMFCAGYMDGSKDSCQGDSGGPLIQDNKLSGIVSWGGSDTQACGAPNFPGVYTRVANYIDWIESYTGSLNSSSSSVSSSSSSNSSSSLSSNPVLEEIFIEIDNAKDINELNSIVIKYMGNFNGVYPN